MINHIEMFCVLSRLGGIYLTGLKGSGSIDWFHAENCTVLNWDCSYLLVLLVVSSVIYHMDAEGQNWPLKSTFTSLPKMWPKQRHRGEVHSVVLKAKLLLKLAHCRCCGGNRLQVSEWWYKCDQYSVCLFGFCWQPWTVCWKDSNATFLPANVYGSCWSIWNSEINAMVFPCYHKQLIQF